jgi:ferredoxin-nitrate reductase
VIGGGLLGLEAAAGVRARGVPVTVVEASHRLMPTQLDGGGARMLGRALAGLGIPALCGARVAGIADDAVTLDDRALPADIVVVATGVRPEVSLARDAGLAVGRGILVDDALRTSAPGVFAAGECAEHRGTVYGLWAPLAEQARAAAAGVCGQPGAFSGALTATTLKVAGVGVFAGGTAVAGEGADELIWSDGRRGVYRKLVVDDDRLVGAVLVGDVEGARELSALLRAGTPVPDHLLEPPGAAPAAPRPLDDASTLCTCNGVSTGEVRRAIRAGGLTTPAAVGRVTRATTGCGSCLSEVERLLAVHRVETKG